MRNHESTTPTGSARAFTAALILSLCIGCGPDPIPVYAQFPPPFEGISSVRPASAAAGSAELTLTIRGTSFEANGMVQSVAYWFQGESSTPLVTHVLSESELTTVVPASLLLAPGHASVAVALYDSATNSIRRVTNHLDFAVNEPSPALTALEPARAVTGSRDITVRLLGQRLHYSWHVKSLAVWRQGSTRVPLATAIVSDAELTAVIPAALLASPRSGSISVEFSDAMEGIPEGRTNSLLFEVVSR